MATSHSPVQRRLRRLALVSTALALAAPSIGQSASYGWPVRPFDQQHPIRGYFGDPRIGETPHGESKSFHFGVDVSAPDGTAVYATISGTVVWEPERPETVSIRAADGRVFAYWHIVPAVRDGSQATSYRTVLGRIAAGWEHVHFAEFERGRYLNPLRRGALTPYRDTTRPSVHLLSFERDGTPVGRTALAGRFDLVAEVEDETPVAVPGRWGGKPVMPMLVRWRLLGAHRLTTSWRTAVDFSTTIPGATLFDAVYARWTRQNHAWRSGRYRLHLARAWDSRAYVDGVYRLEVLVKDTAGNASRFSRTFSVRN